MGEISLLTYFLRLPASVGRSKDLLRQVGIGAELPEGRQFCGLKDQQPDMGGFRVQCWAGWRCSSTESSDSHLRSVLARLRHLLLRRRDLRQQQQHRQQQEIVELGRWEPQEVWGYTAQAIARKL